MSDSRETLKAMVERLKPTTGWHGPTTCIMSADFSRMLSVCEAVNAWVETEEAIASIEAEAFALTQDQRQGHFEATMRRNVALGRLRLASEVSSSGSPSVSEKTNAVSQKRVLTPDAET